MLKKVELGSKVTIRNLENDQIITKVIKYQKTDSRPHGGTGAYYELRSIDEVKPEKLSKNVITDESPMGQALLGKTLNDEFVVAKRRYKILNID